jgi:hypothetical protein
VGEDPLDVFLRLGVWRDPAVPIDGLLAGIVRRQRQRQIAPVPVNQATQVPHPSVDILARIEGVADP